MQRIDLETAGRLIDFSGGDKQLAPLGQLQLEGAVALQNILSDPDVGVGYLADEVGMGKTYVALGVVALMRSLNPSLRVLYICPSTNVQEKWCYRELPAFIQKNFRGTNFNVRTPQGSSGTPSVFCNNVDELISAATTGYYGDVFVRMSSFSMAMGEKEEDLEREFERLRERVPAALLGRRRLAKQDIKRAYAKALNYLLPTFDLVVIDEAHNFKHGFDSSARNLALSRILGFNQDDGEQYMPRVRQALLLSATPFDVNPEHLFNQLNLVGKGHLLPEREEWDDRQQFKAAMTRFLVRRLNTLTIQEKLHTRNMYRREWRKGEKAEIELPSDEHKLITALVQKHVGDMLNRQGGNPAFQLGLLASFESYAQTARTADAAMFDGDEADKAASEAPDRHLIDIVRTGYVQEEKFGMTLPHPKMDQVSREVAALAFESARKQLVFVRRVRSVNELKQKLDDEYNAWLERHLLGVLDGHGEQVRFMGAVIDAFRSARKDRDDDISGGDVKVAAGGDDEQVLPKTDTLFNWFFRGEKPTELDRVLKAHPGWPAPENLKKSLISKNNANVLCFELNWADWAANAVIGAPLDDVMATVGDQAVLDELGRLGGVPEDDQLSTFLVAQVAFLRALSASRPELAGLRDIADYLQPVIRPGSHRLAEVVQVKRQLSIRTFFNRLDDAGLSVSIFSSPAEIVGRLQRGERVSFETIQKVELHRQLIAQGFRTGHAFIDLYLSRLMMGDADVSEERRQLWLQVLCKLLADQLQRPGFSSAIELSLLNENLDLVIKNNLPNVYARGPAELRVWLNQELPSSAPVIGANGLTRGSRSVQARKFRMPGYPLVLVSTDVFQEGEDLHTFCDSVVHYGLSASPISIEQKTGRVDRVGAFSHRRLLRIKGSDPVADDDFIQVRFPYVKQSIEAIQVRVLARRMNEFLGSLHEIGGKAADMDAFVNSSRELADRNEIPDQLLEFLESPYVPVLSRKPNAVVQKRVAQREKEDWEALDHVQTLVKAVSGSAPDRHGRMQLSIDGATEERFFVEVSSARSHGEVLLRARRERRLNLLSLREWPADRVRDLQATLYVTSRARTYGVCEEKDSLALYQDAEMLVGGTEMTCREDVLGFFRRFQPADPEEGWRGGRSQQLPVLDDERISRMLEHRYRWSGSFSSRAWRDHVELVFRFQGEESRRHAICARQLDGYCVMEAMIAGEDVVRGLSVDRLLDLTWRRNLGIDLAEALVRPDGCLVARVLHPLRSLDEREFVFSAYVLAAEADRLEYLIKVPDDY